MGSSSINTDQYLTDTGRLKVFKLVGTMLTAVVGLVVAAWISALERFTELNVWIMGGIADFGADLVSTTLGKSASLQVRAFEEAARETLMLGPFRPWLFAFEALIVTALFALALRAVID